MSLQQPPQAAALGRRLAFVAALFVLGAFLAASVWADSPRDRDRAEAIVDSSVPVLGGSLETSPTPGPDPCQATYTVTSTADSGAGSLREGLSKVCDGGTIDFSLSYPAEITLSSDELTVAVSVTISGPGADNLAVSGDGKCRVFRVNSGVAATIEGLTIRDGMVNASEYGGAGILAFGPLTLKDSVLTNNRLESFAVAEGESRLSGAIYGGYGGAVFFGGEDTHELTIENTRFVSNTALYGGGGLFVYEAKTASLDELTFEHNRAYGGGYTYGAGWLDADETKTGSLDGLTFQDSAALSGAAAGYGGAAFIMRSVYALSSSTVYSNVAAYGGGLSQSESQGTVSGTNFQENLGGWGAGVAAGIQRVSASSDGVNLSIDVRSDAITITSSSLYTNTATQMAGGMSGQNTTCVVSDTEVSGNVAPLAAGLGYSFGNYTLSGLTVQHNAATMFGGGIAAGSSGYDASAGDVRLAEELPATVVTITASTLYSNTAGGGGGMYFVQATVYGDELMIRDNKAAVGGGACSSGSVVSINDSAFVGNTAQGYDAAGAGYTGDRGTTRFTNVTFGENQTIDESDLDSMLDKSMSARGGALGFASEEVHLLNCTVVGNSATSTLTETVGSGAGGISVLSPYFVSESALANGITPVSVTLTNTLVAGNTSAAGRPDVAGAFVSGGHNLIGQVDGSTGFSNTVNGDQVGSVASPLDAKLDTLDDYGSDTLCYGLFSDSPAVDTADDAQSPAADQRGVERPYGDHSDIGAYERNVPPIEPALIGWPAVLCPGYNLHYTIELTNPDTRSAATGVVVTATVPEGTWFNAGDATGTVTGVYSEAGGERLVTWNIGTVAASSKATAQLLLHSYSSLTDGTLITETFGWVADHTEGGLLDVASEVDTTDCEEPVTPDLTIYGVVYGTPRAAGGASLSVGEYTIIPGALVTATSCVSGTWTALADEEGRYEITIPGEVTDMCSALTLAATAPSHFGTVETLPMADLLDDPVQDLYLEEWYKLFAPIFLGG